jgi:hypothetical protein
VDLFQAFSQVIDTRSFSSLWFWIVLVVFWSLSSHYVVGVPYDMVIRARRHGGEADQDLRDMVRVSTNRIMYIVDTAGVFLVCFVMFWLTFLVILAVLYRIEFAQALLCFYVPMLLVGMWSLRTARQFRAHLPEGTALHKRLFLHRIGVQFIGMFCVFVTSMWGIWVSLHPAIF